ncbi:MAG: hypothetical protein Q9170_007742, partial [Blastenia crenularia]
GKGDVEMGDGGGEEQNEVGEKIVGRKKLGAVKLPANGARLEENGEGDDVVPKSVEDVGVVIHDDD